MTYSESTKSDMRYIFNILPVQYRASCVNTTEFQFALIVSSDTVWVVTPPLYSSSFPPAVICTLCNSSTISGRSAAVYCEYVTVLLAGTWCSFIQCSTSNPSIPFGENP